MAPVLADLVAAGRMTEEEAARDSRRHSLRSAVMGDDILLIDVSSQPVAVKKGDRLILASDGFDDPSAIKRSRKSSRKNASRAIGG